MTDYRFSRNFYKPRRRKWKLAIVLFLILAVGGGIVYTVFFLDVRTFTMRAIALYRVTFSDYRFLEKSLQSGNYNQVIRDGLPYLEKRPYKARLIRYIGEAYYHVSGDLNGAEREESIDKSIRYMRKGIVLAGSKDFLSKGYFILGMSYFRKGAYYYELAAEYLKKSLDGGYKEDSLFEILGYCYYKLGVFDEAVVYLEKAKSHGSKEVERQEVVRLYLAESYKGKGDHQAAMAELSALEQSSKDDAILEEVHSITAWVYFQMGNFAAAREYLGKVLEMNQSSAEAHYWLGNILEKERDMISARKEWRTALRINPKHIGAIEKLY